MIVLSGYAAPIENMPPLAELVSRADPVRYMLVIARGLFLQDMPLARGAGPGVADGSDRGSHTDRGRLRGAARGELIVGYPRAGCVIRRRLLRCPSQGHLCPGGHGHERCTNARSSVA